MNHNLPLGFPAPILALALILSAAGLTRAQTETGAALDVSHYRIAAELLPDSHTLKAQATVTFRTLRPTQSAIFEMNGSLGISSVKGPDGKTELQFVQDRIDELTVRINLGELYQPGSELSLTFDYSGPLVTPEGGPIPDLRLAYIGPEGAYLFYAARWFPFHGYASDRATSEISLTVPDGWSVAGYSELPVVETTEKDGRKTLKFSHTKPILPGSFAAGPFITRTIRSAGLQVDLYATPGAERRLEEFGQEIVQILQFYSQRFGPYEFGERYVVAEVDDITLDTYTGAGILFLPRRVLTSTRDLPLDDLGREVGYQWWGQAVGLKNFDDAWLSQGLAEYSSVLYRESIQNAPEFQATLLEILELALAFEQEASIARAPAVINDQSPAYRSIVFYKGAYVYHMLRNTIGDDKFFELVRRHYEINRGRSVGIDDFEDLAERVAGENLRGFFGLWVDSTGVPEFHLEYAILRTRDGFFRVRGTVRQNLDTFRGPVDVEMRSEGGREARTTIDLRGTSADFDLQSEGMPLEVVVDPDNRYMRISDSIRTSVVVRRGIQHFQREEYAEAEEQFRAAIRLSPRSSWAWYNRGLLFMEQRNWREARDAFTAALNSDLDPYWIEVWSYILRGNAFDAEGQRDRAVAEYNKAIETGNNYNGAQDVANKYLGEPYRRERTTAST